MRVFVLLLLLLAPISAFAQPQVDPRDAALLKQAAELLQAEQYAQARNLLREGLAGREHPPPVLLQALGNALYLTDDLAGAHDAYKQALENDPDNAALCRNLALAAYGLERFAESAPLFERAHELAGKEADINLLYQAAASWVYADRFTEAARVLDAAWPQLSQPNFSWLKLNALVRTKTGRHAAGIRAIRQALRAQPESRKLWLLLADSEVLGERYGQAAAALEVALRLDSNDDKTKLADRLAGAYAGAGLPFLVARSLEQAPGHGTAKALDRLAGLYVRSGRPEQALRVLGQAQQSAPRAERTKRMALVCYEFGLHARAAGLFERYLQAAPKDHEARMLLARTAMTIMDMKTARQALSAIPPDSAYHETAQEWLTLLNGVP